MNTAHRMLTTFAALTALAFASTSATGDGLDIVFWQPGVDDSWFTGENWSNQTVPTANDLVIIDAPFLTCVVESSGATAAQVTVGVAASGILTLSGDGVLNTGGGVVADGADSSGAVTLMTGSSWTTGDIFVGDEGDGTLDILHGSTVNCESGILGFEFTGEGSALIEGDESSWVCTTILAVGNFGYGTLSMTDGGDASCTECTVGFQSDGIGDIIVDGNGSMLSVGNQLLIGENGFGTMEILNDADVTSSVGGIGAFAGSEGTVTVSGTGSTWSNSSGLAVGNQAAATLNILNGGAVSNVDAELAIHAGSTGTAVVDGDGSIWSTSNILHVGKASTGTLTVRDLGTVAATNGIVLATFDGGNGILNIESDTSVGLIDAPEILGGNGTATLNFNHQGASYFFTRDGSSGGPPVALTGSTTVNHIGDGSTFLFGPNTYTGGTNVHRGRLAVHAGGSISHPDTDIFIGIEPGDDGELSLDDGAMVHNAFANIGNDADAHGEARVSDPGSVWANEFDLRVGRGGTGELLVNLGGQVSCRTGVIGDFDGSDGAAIVTGEGSTWSSSNIFFVGVAGDATLTVANHGVVDVDGSFQIANASSSTGTLNIGDGGDAGMLDVASVNGGAGNATLNFNHNEAEYNFVRDLALGSDPVEITGSTAVNHIGSGRTTLSGNNTYTGPTTIDAGELRINGSVPNSTTTVNENGTLSGSGAVADVDVFGGAISPGNDVGTLSTGSLSLVGDTVLEFELGPLAGPSDMIEVNGNLVLDGILNVTNVGGMEAGEYTLLTYTGSLTDNNLSLVGAPAEFDYALIATSNSVVLHVVRGDDCPADISEPTDGEVNTSDLLVLLANWGTDGPGADIAEPDTVVNAADLLELLAAWGFCR